MLPQWTLSYASRSDTTLPKIAVLACSVFENEVALHAGDAKHVMQVRYFEMGLHDKPDRLRSTLQQNLDDMDGLTNLDTTLLRTLRARDCRTGSIAS